ncbi:MAG: response regulator [Proteobacteria bacterium]|jgi:CheY-like chemotaxis protein|nr:response regulator [Pseudomonadota bacterium]
MTGEKILIVEDDPMNMELFRDLLEVKGYIIYEAVEANEAIEQSRENKFALILMDIQLPGMDGLTATKIIKEQSKNKNTPIVALTAYAMKGDKERIEGAGCDGYITKPINTKEFPEEVAVFFK